VKVGAGAGDGVLLGVGVGLATLTGVDEAVAVGVADGSALLLASADAGHSDTTNAAYINGLIAETSRKNRITRPTSLRAPKHQVIRRRRAVSPALTTALVQAPVSQWQTALSVRPQCSTRIVPCAMGQIVPWYSQAFSRLLTHPTPRIPSLRRSLRVLWRSLASFQADGGYILWSDISTDRLAEAVADQVVAVAVGAPGVSVAWGQPIDGRRSLQVASTSDEGRMSIPSSLITHHAPLITSRSLLGATRSACGRRWLLPS
jgi:hypothetical protein